jgi:hypothetical protein
MKMVFRSLQIYTLSMLLLQLRLVQKVLEVDPVSCTGGSSAATRAAGKKPLEYA